MQFKLYIINMYSVSEWFGSYVQRVEFFFPSPCGPVSDELVPLKVVLKLFQVKNLQIHHLLNLQMLLASVRLESHMQFLVQFSEPKPEVDLAGRSISPSLIIPHTINAN